MHTSDWAQKKLHVQYFNGEFHSLFHSGMAAAKPNGWAAAVGGDERVEIKFWNFENEGLRNGKIRQKI